MRERSPAGLRRGFVRRAVHRAGLKSGGVGGAASSELVSRVPTSSRFFAASVSPAAATIANQAKYRRLDKVFWQTKAVREQNREIILAVVYAIFGRLAKPQGRACVIGLAVGAFDGENAEIVHGARVALFGGALIR